MRVNGEHGKLGLLESLRVLVGRLLKKNAEAGFKVDGQTGGVLATDVQAVGELQSARLHNHGVGGRAQHVSGYELEADETI